MKWGVQPWLLTDSSNVTQHFLCTHNLLAYSLLPVRSVSTSLTPSYCKHSALTDSHNIHNIAYQYCMCDLQVSHVCSKKKNKRILCVYTANNEHAQIAEYGTPSTLVYCYCSRSTSETLVSCLHVAQASVKVCMLTGPPACVCNSCMYVSAETICYAMSNP